MRPDYVIYILDFSDWILDNRFVPEQAKDWFDGHARLALCNYLTNNFTHAATWVDDDIDAWPYFPKDKIICTCDPNISRAQIQAEIDSFPQGLYGMFSSDWIVGLVSSVEITENAMTYSCGDLTEHVYRNKDEWSLTKDEE